MAQELIINTPVNSGLGDPDNIAFGKCNANFTELYGNVATLQTNVGGLQTSVTTLQGQVTILQTPAGIGGILYPQTGAEATAGVTPANLAIPPGNAWRYLSPVQLTSVLNRDLSADCTVALQNWLNVNGYSGQIGYLPYGAYAISAGLILNNTFPPGAPGNYEGCVYSVQGDGAVSTVISNTVSPANGTLIVANGNFIPFRYINTNGAGTGSGTYRVQGVGFIQLSTTATQPVVQLDTCTDNCQFAFNSIYQSGTGNGLVVLSSAIGQIHSNNIVNSGEGTAGLGASRTGIGIYVAGLISEGAGKIVNNTLRGWLDGITLFNSGLIGQVHEIEGNNFSFCYRGVTDGNNSTRNYKTIIKKNYFEGMEGPWVIKSFGYSPSIVDNILQTNSGAAGAPCWTTGIDITQSVGYAVVTRNFIGMPTNMSGTPGAPVAGINVVGSRILPATVTDNYIVVNLGLIGSYVVGIYMSGADALIKHSGNMFNPAVGWTGTGNFPIQDATTTSDGSGTTGVQGFGVTFDSLTDFPVMKRGALSLYGNPTPLGNGAVSANVLTVGLANYYLVTFTSAQTINAIAGLTTGQPVTLRVTNGNATFTNGINIKLAGSVNFTPGANGCSITFICRPGSGVAEEIYRTAY